MRVGSIVYVYIDGTPSFGIIIYIDNDMITVRKFTVSVSSRNDIILNTIVHYYWTYRPKDVFEYETRVGCFY